MAVHHEFRRFASDWLVQHTMSSPAYPWSNGQAERMVQTAKNLLRKCSQDNTDYQQDLTRFNKIATQGAPQMAVDKEANSLSRVYSYYSKFNLRLFYV